MSMDFLPLGENGDVPVDHSVESPPSPDAGLGKGQPEAAPPAAPGAQ